MKSALITGGAGFIGSNLAKLLLNNNYNVTILDNMTTGKITNIENILGDNCRLVNTDINNYNILDDEVKKVDIIFHLAAFLGVERILEDPTSLMVNNILSTKNILDSCLKNNKKLFLASTSEIYGKLNKPQLAEGDSSLLGNPKQIRWSYSISKLANEMMAYHYFRDYGLKVVIGRFFNTVGSNQSEKYGAVIPRFIEKSLKDENLVVYGDGRQTRTFSDVEEVCLCIKLLMEKENVFGEAFNIGGKEEITINELAELIIRLSNSQSKITYQDVPNKFGEEFEEIIRRVPSVTKLYEYINFTPEKGIEDIIKKILLEKQNNENTNFCISS